MLGIRSLTPTTPVGNYTVTLNRRGWIRWAEPLIEVGADIHGRIDGPARDAVLREIFALLCPLAGGWSTPPNGAKGEFCQL